MSKCKSETKYDRTILYGLSDIAKYVDFSIGTVRRWKRREGFPMAKLPNGVYMSSTELVDRWVLARAAVENAAREL
jgi:hypothetical protein